MSRRPRRLSQMGRLHFLFESARLLGKTARFSVFVLASLFYPAMYLSAFICEVCGSKKGVPQTPQAFADGSAVFSVWIRKIVGENGAVSCLCSCLLVLYGYVFVCVYLRGLRENKGCPADPADFRRWVGCIFCLNPQDCWGKRRGFLSLFLPPCFIRLCICLRLSAWSAGAKKDVPQTPQTFAEALAVFSV